MSRFLATRRVFVVIFFLGLFILAARSIHDPDLWWHLRTGEYMASTGHIPHQDVFSFTRAGKPWIAHEWLSELFLYSVFRVAGFGGLIVVFGAIIGAAFVITYLRCAGRPYIAAAIVLLGALAGISAWGVRPQMLSLLFTSILLALLDRAETRDAPQNLWWIAPLMLLWVNVHAGYVVGLVTIVFTLVGWFVENPMDQGLRPKKNRRVRILGMVLLASVAVVPLNPNGYELFRYPFQTLRSHSMQAFIMEWASPNFHQANIQPFLALLLLTFAVFAVWPKRPRMSQLLLMLGTMLGALTSVRHVPIFALVVIPEICERISGALTNRPKFLVQPIHRMSLPKAVVNAVLLVGMASFVVLRLEYELRVQPDLEATYFPAAAVSFIEQDHCPAPIFNYYDWGGYLIWRLYPDYRVFIDGRADVYGDKLMDQFIQTTQARSGWDQILDEYRIRTVVIPPGNKLAGVLRLRSEWKIEFEDTQAIIFVRRANLTGST